MTFPFVGNSRLFLRLYKKKSTALQTKYSAFLVENSGIEPLTSCMPCKRSPERYRNTPPHESVGAGLISRCYVLSTEKVHSCILLPGIMLRLQGNFTTQFLSVSMGFAQREGHLREKIFSDRLLSAILILHIKVALFIFPKSIDKEVFTTMPMYYRCFLSVNQPHDP